MSIARRQRRILRSFRTLIKKRADMAKPIKDLKDLENGTTHAAIDIKDLKDLKRPLDDGQRGGLSPAISICANKARLLLLMKRRASTPLERTQSTAQTPLRRNDWLLQC